MRCIMFSVHILYTSSMGFHIISQEKVHSPKEVDPPECRTTQTHHL